MPFGGDSYRSCKPCQTGWAILGVVRRNESLCCSVCSKRDHSVIYNGMSPRLLQPTAILATGRCHITSSPVKTQPLRCGFLSKFIDHLFVSYVAVRYNYHARRYHIEWSSSGWSWRNGAWTETVHNRTGLCRDSSKRIQDECVFTHA